MFDTDFDPYQVLVELSENQVHQSELTKRLTQVINSHSQTINELTHMVNNLNLRICRLENHLNQAELRIQKYDETDNNL